MARAIFMRDAFDTFADHLDAISGSTEEITKKALYEGAKVYADAMKSELSVSIKDKNRNELIDAFGISPMKTGRNFEITVHLGFDGYQDNNGKRIPFQMIARSLNSGAFKDGKQIIKATHFAENAVKKSKKTAQTIMKKTIDELINQKLNGG